MEYRHHTIKIKLEALKKNDKICMITLKVNYC